MPTIPPDRGNAIAFAAVVVLAVAELPNADPNLVTEANALAMYVLKNCHADGSIKLFESATGADDKSRGSSYAIGLALQCLVASHRLKPDPAKLAAVARGIGHYRVSLKSQPQPILAAALLPAVADYFLTTRDSGAMTVAFELADALCEFQYTRVDARQASWSGGFRIADGSEPTAETASYALGLAAATSLTRQAPDLARFAKYRTVCVDAIMFSRGLQFSDETADHFEKGFRTRFLLGGVHLTPTDGMVRADATAQLLSACVRFLESGAETRQE